MTTTSVIEEKKNLQVELSNLKEELLRIKAITITEQKMVRILREEFGTHNYKYRNGFEKIQRQILQIKINNNPGKSSGLDFSDFQPPPSLPWGKPFEESNEKDKRKQIADNED